MRILAITFFAALIAIKAIAHADSTPLPADTSRILKTFDFEERALGNDEDQPMHWEKVTGDDYPQYVGGRMTSDLHRSGNYSFRIDLDGGSCIYRYHPGLLKVQPGTHYRLEGYCKTSVLRYARARLSAYFLDQDLRPIPNSVRHSDPYAGNGGDDDWHLLAVELTADQDHAAFLVVQMELLQPSQYSTSTLGRHSLFLQDIHGSAWFDDVAVTQIPQVTLKTSRPGNLFRQSDPLKLTVDVNDRETDDLTAQLLVDDALGKRVYQHTGTIDISSAKVVGAAERELTVDLPAVSPGWYRASLLMMSHGTYVGRESVAWILLPDDGTPAPADPRFGVVARDLPFDAWQDLPKFLPLLAAGRVKLPMWSSHGDVQNMDADQLDGILRTLQLEEITPAGCLVQLPPKLSEELGGNSWLQLLTAPSESWQNPLAFMISRHANRVDRWQLGTDETAEFAENPDMRKAYWQVYKQFTNLIDKPDLAMPCPVTYELPNPLPAAIELSVPTNVLPAQIPLYLQDCRQENQGICLSLCALDPDQYDRNTRIADLAERVVYALASNVPHFDLPMPVDVHQQGDQQTVEPQELAIIERTLLSNLSGAQYRGKLPIAEDVNAFLFERNRKGIVVLWSRDTIAGKPRTVAVNLGEHLISLDLWGNATPLSRPSTPQGDDDDATNRTHAAAATSSIAVGRLPIILTGVDSDMARLRVSLSVDQPLIESTFQAHTRRLRFSNPFNQPIGGTLKLHAPPGWNLNPPSFTFTLNPGEMFEKEVAIEFPYNSIAGPQNLVADFNIQADRHVVFSEPLGLVLGLSDIGTRCMAYRFNADVVVQQLISNYGDHPITYSTFASYPGRPRIERLVTTLAPGQTVIKKYRFVNFPLGKKSKIRVGLKEMDGNRILNDEVEVE